ncbi:hypothetical protein KCP71_13920 [Salmonella enterica subsp. enterica]|nr:hypothetical protein KCP71_13920 [Salmonella enterica subsp. enterica]
MNRSEEAGEKLITANDIRAAHARGEQAMSVVLRASIITPGVPRGVNYWASRLPNATSPSRHQRRRVKSETQRIQEAIIAQLGRTVC